jgi:hypothetical protein
MSTILSAAMYFIRAYISGISTMPAENFVPAEERRKLAQQVSSRALILSRPAPGRLSAVENCINGKSM